MLLESLVAFSREGALLREGVESGTNGREVFFSVEAGSHQRNARTKIEGVVRKIRKDTVEVGEAIREPR